MSNNPLQSMKTWISAVLAALTALWGWFGWLVVVWASLMLAALTALWGWFGWLVVVWASLMLADWLIGSAAAMKDGRWSSAKLREGAWHKGGMIIVAVVAMVADWLIATLLAHMPGVTLPFTYSVLLGPLVIVWYILGELGSLAEHAVTFGAKVPRWLLAILAVGKDAVDAAGSAMAGEGKEEEKDG